MLILPIEDARAGMALAAPVSHPEHPGQELLKYGYVLEDEVLQRMRAMGVHQIYVAYPGLDDLDRHLEPNLSPARQKIYQQVKESVIASQKNSHAAVSYSDYYATTRDLISTLMCQGQHPVYIESMSHLGTEAITHATAVAHLGLLMGIKLEMYVIQQRKPLPAHHAKEVVNLGVAGMLHDMGKLSLPAELQKYNGVNLPEDPEQLKAWQQHTTDSYELVRNGIEPSAANAIMHHHQHWDGSGFPVTVYNDGTQSPRKENRIHIFARILAVANLYDRLAAPAGSPRRRPNVEVLHLIRKHYESWCDSVVLKTLQAVCPPFPPGTMVTLSDESSAVVVELDPNNPYQPTVKRFVGNDRHMDEKKFDLRTEGTPTITHVDRLAVESMLPERISSAEISATDR